MAQGKILVVDDEEDLRDILHAALVEEGYAVEVAKDGVEAVERLAVTDYDLIVSDIRMPRLGGIELLQEARARWPTTEVVLVTGYASAETEMEARRLGAFGWLEKPVELDDLLATVSRAVTHRLLIAKS